MAQLTERRTQSGWNKTNPNYYNQKLCWVVKVRGITYDIVVNEDQNHFARKHLLLPSVRGKEMDKSWFERKVKERVTHRNDGQARHVQKYGHEGEFVPKNTVINMAEASGYDYVLKETLGTVIVEAVLKAGQSNSVRLGFSNKCVMVWSTEFTGRLRPRNWVWMSFKYHPSRGRAVIAPYTIS